MQSDQRLRIDTPEQIPLELSLAGIGSRFLAVAVDTVLQAALSVAGVLAFMVGPGIAGLPALFRQVGPALGILFLFCVYWGYFAFFEILWSGRTPGKRIAGIRVIKDSGRPINA
ncbi:MAG TPA: RDD family protein, partial [Vicinamibacterales bacterium]|nr:RDD family protein [Vicinamibacterales bacterium]